MPPADPKLRLLVRHSDSSKDRALAEELLGHLKPLQRFANLDVWSDARLRPGDETRREIERAIDQADVVLLLLSSDFFSSDTLLDVEVPKLLEKHRQGSLKVVPVLLRSCHWEAHPWLSELRPLPRDGKPIASHQGDKRDRVMSELVKEISGLMTPSGSASVATSADGRTAGTTSMPAKEAGTTYNIHIQNSTLGSAAFGDGATGDGRVDMRPVVEQQSPPTTSTAASRGGHRISHGTEIIHPVTSVGEVSHKVQESTWPFRIEHLELSNLKGITSVELDFTASSGLPGQWTCLAGLNGAGKSTILQGIALALLGDHLVPELGQKRLATLRRRGSDAHADTEIRAWVRDGEVLRELYIPLGVGGLNQEALNANKQIVAMREFWRRREANLIFAAYGARRSLSWHRDERNNHLSIDVRRQMTLFDPSAQMASTGLLAERGGKMNPVFDTFRSLVDAVFDDLSVRVVEDDGIKFSVDDAVISPDELSDGYRTTIGWLLDLSAAWHDKAPALARQGDLSAMHGIVLIDEIELHLHPRWQRNVVTNLRRTLPGVQWIVSTHSPLVLSSFDPKEMLIIEHGRCVGPSYESHDLTLSPNFSLAYPPQSEAATNDLTGGVAARQVQVERDRET